MHCGGRAPRESTVREPVSAFASLSSQQNCKGSSPRPLSANHAHERCGQARPPHPLPQVHLGRAWQPAGQETELGGGGCLLTWEGTALGRQGPCLVLEKADSIGRPSHSSGLGGAGVGRGSGVVLCKVTEGHLCRWSPRRREAVVPSCPSSLSRS